MKSETKKANSRTVKKYVFVYTMLAATLLHFIIFYLYVNFSSIILPFVDSQTGEWNDFYYFKMFFEQFKEGFSTGMLSYLANTLKYFVTNTFISLPLSLFCAYFLYKKIMGHNVFSVVFMLPMILSGVVFAAIYENLLTGYGPVGQLIMSITGSTEDPLLLSTKDTATTAMIIYNIWTGFGLNLILFSGGMSRIPNSVVEAGMLDGVGFWRELFQISLPLIWPTFSLILMLGVMNVFGSSGPILLFTKGQFGTTTLDYWMYTTTVHNNQYNMAGAFGMLMTLASLPIFLFVMWLRKKLDSGVQY